MSGTTTSNASSGSPPWAPGSVSSGSTSTERQNESGQPWQSSSGSARAAPGTARACRTCTPRPPAPESRTRKRGSRLRAASCAGQSNPSAQYATSAFSSSTSAPIDQPTSSGASGQRVARSRALRSSSSAGSVLEMKGSTAAGAASDSAGSVTGRAVVQLPEEVEVAVVPRVLLDEVQQDPAQGGWFARTVRRGRAVVEVEPGDQRVGAAGLLDVAVEDLGERQRRPVDELLVGRLVGPGAEIGPADEPVLDPGVLDPAQVVDHAADAHQR